MAVYRRSGGEFRPAGPDFFTRPAEEPSAGYRLEAEPEVEVR
jgi:hypothetical protein